MKKLLLTAALSALFAACGGPEEARLGRSTQALTDSAKAEAEAVTAEGESARVDDAELQSFARSMLTEEAIAAVEKAADEEELREKGGDTRVTEGRFRRCASQQGAPTCAVYWLVGILKTRYPN